MDLLDATDEGLTPQSAGITTARINDDGMQQIVEGLVEHHKPGREHLTEAALNEWASVVESSIDEGSGAQFYLSSNESVSGYIEIIEISESGYDLV